MLVLTRRIHEVIIIKDRVTKEEIRVVILPKNGGQVRLGFQSSHRFKIIREELIEGNTDASRKETESNVARTPFVPEGFDELD